MNFTKHTDLEGKHALLGASQWHWINYDSGRIADLYLKQKAVLRGIELHAFAEQCIRLGQKLPKSSKTLNQYVNDAIGYKMTPEVVLYYSPFCFGTTDAISFREKEKVLRIHDLKTGETPAHMEQLKIYAALFCLEYKKDPFDISIELRIYQFNDIEECFPEPDDIKALMDKIRESDLILQNVNIGGITDD